MKIEKEVGTTSDVQQQQQQNGVPTPAHTDQANLADHHTQSANSHIQQMANATTPSAQAASNMKNLNLGNVVSLDEARKRSDYTADWELGVADPAFWERVAFMTWQLKSGVSASAGIKSWLKGFTVAESLSTITVVQTDVVRATMGDANFVATFGARGHEVPDLKRLRIGALSPSLMSYTETSAARDAGQEGTLGNRPVKEGDWYTFSNHSAYGMKHPAGPWQSFYAIYVGKNVQGEQTWSGLGNTAKTEREILAFLADKHNASRSAADQKKLQEIDDDEAGLPAAYDPKSFADQISADDIVTTGSGFSLRTGYRLDLSSIKK